MKTHTIARAGAGLLTAGVLALGGAMAANAAPDSNAAATTTVIAGHTDIVSVACDANNRITVDTFREDGGHISPANIGNYTFLFDRSAINIPAAFWYANGMWTATGDERYEDDLPFIGFQYTEALNPACPASVSFDVAKVSGAANAGDAVFTANDAVAGSTSSAAGDTRRVTLWKPGSGANKPSHEHGPWTFAAPASGGDFTLQFTAYLASSNQSLGSAISPVHIRVQD
jgi:hypothetical protein